MLLLITTVIITLTYHYIHIYVILCKCSILRVIYNYSHFMNEKLRFRKIQ